MWPEKNTHILQYLNLTFKVGMNEQVEITSHAINDLSLNHRFSSKISKTLFKKIIFCQIPRSSLRAAEEIF